MDTIFVMMECCAIGTAIIALTKRTILKKKQMKLQQEASQQEAIQRCKVFRI